MSDLLRKVIPDRKAGARPASNTDEIPVAGLSICYPIFLGIDENGRAVYLELPYRNLLCAGEPGGGKSVLLSNIIGHAALCPDVRLVLIDGKEVELGMWRDVADVFVGMDHKRVLTVLRDLQVQMDNRYDWLAANRRRKILGSDGIPFVL